MCFRHTENCLFLGEKQLFWWFSSLLFFICLTGKITFIAGWSIMKSAPNSISVLELHYMVCECWISLSCLLKNCVNIWLIFLKKICICASLNVSIAKLFSQLSFDFFEWINQFQPQSAGTGCSGLWMLQYLGWITCEPGYDSNTVLWLMSRQHLLHIDDWSDVFLKMKVCMEMERSLSQKEQTCGGSDVFVTTLSAMSDSFMEVHWWNLVSFKLLLWRVIP